MEIVLFGDCDNYSKGVWTFHVKETNETYSGIVFGTTKNRMELQSYYEALQYLKLNNVKELVTVYSHQTYLTEAINKGWLDKWIRQGWNRSETKIREVKNIDLWQSILTIKQNVKLVWVKLERATYHENLKEANRKLLGLTDEISDEQTERLLDIEQLINNEVFT